MAALAIALQLATATALSAEQKARTESRQDKDWAYVVPPEAHHAIAPPRAIRLSNGGQQMVRTAVDFRGHQRRFGQFVYGTPNSAPVTVVVDQLSKEKIDLYVDANRDRLIQANERQTVSLSAAGQGGPIPWPVGAATLKNLVTTTVPRTVLFWVGSGGKSLRYATAGYVQGKVALEGHEVAMHRVDADGDGFVTGPLDLVWMDLDRDGKWNPFAERFPLTPILRLGDARYGLQTVGTGVALRLQEITASGFITSKPKMLDSPGAIRKITVALAGRDGTGVMLTSVEKPMAVPVGDYYVYNVTLLVDDPNGDDPWYYHFGPLVFGEQAIRWHTVKADRELTIDPLAGLSLSAYLLDPPARRSEPNQELTVRTSLKTDDGLYLKICCRTDTWDLDKGTEAEVFLRSMSDEMYFATKSGFA